MLEYKEPLSKRNKAETGIRYEWYAMQRWGAKYWDLFFQPHICWKAVGRNLAFALVEAGTFLTAPASFISAGIYNKTVLAFYAVLLVPISFIKIVIRQEQVT